MSAWKRRWDEAKLSFRLLIKSPLAATGLLIVLVYVGIALYVQFFAAKPDTMTPTNGPFPIAPFWWPGGSTAGGLLGIGGFPYWLNFNTEIPKAIRIDLAYSVFVVLVGALIGTMVGVYSSYKGGLFDEALMRITDVTYSIPFLILVIAIAYVYSRRDFLTINLVLLLVWWPPYARLVRSQGLSVKELRFVEAARAAGASDARIMLRHVMPNTLAPVFVQISLDLGTVTQVFAALDFIGFASANPLLPELGNMINIGYGTFTSYPWTIVVPGLVLLIFTVGVNLLGDGLRDVLDPRLRR